MPQLLRAMPPAASVPSTAGAWQGPHRLNVALQSIFEQFKIIAVITTVHPTHKAQEEECILLRSRSFHELRIPFWCVNESSTLKLLN